VQVCAPIRHGAHFHENNTSVIGCARSYRTLRDGTFEGPFPRHFVPGYDRVVPSGRGPAGGLSSFKCPGASCLATISLSHRDKSHSPIEGLRIKLALMAFQPWAKFFSPFRATEFAQILLNFAPFCPVPEIRGILPEVSRRFFKARAKRPYLCHSGRASNAEIIGGESPGR
jgi:hypothetical protein